MAVGGTTIGPVEESVRDQVADFRDRHSLPNYNEAVKVLLSRGDTE